MRIRRLDSRAKGFARRFDALCRRGDPGADPEVAETAARIVEDVRTRGDRALLEHTRRLDGWAPKRASGLEVPRAEWEAAEQQLPHKVRRALRQAAERIRNFHRIQRRLELDVGINYRDYLGNRMNQATRPLDRVGVYVPGGTARYPSSVLMTAIPAKIAGVQEVVMVTPTPGGELDPSLLAAAAVAKVDRVFRIGGAQAVAALAYGTRTVPAMDKIVGPGNAWVAAAKRLVRGRVDTDMEAGPSEVLVVADDSAHPDHVALDLLAQAEHDPRAVAVLITTEPALLDAVEAALHTRLAELPRADTARRALAGQGAFILAQDLDEALDLASTFAAEHLELLIRKPRLALKHVRAAGAVFLGPHTPEAVGDYVAGPSHVLPTAGTARFASPLGVHHFVRRMSVLQFNAKGLEAVGDAVETLAEVEGLHAHGRAVAVRRREKPAKGRQAKPVAAEAKRGDGQAKRTGGQAKRTSARRGSKR